MLEEQNDFDLVRSSCKRSLLNIVSLDFISFYKNEMKFPCENEVEIFIENWMGYLQLVSGDFHIVLFFFVIYEWKKLQSINFSRAGCSFESNVFWVFFHLTEIIIYSHASVWRTWMCIFSKYSQLCFLKNNRRSHTVAKIAKIHYTQLEFGDPRNLLL